MPLYWIDIKKGKKEYGSLDIAFALAIAMIASILIGVIIGVNL